MRESKLESINNCLLEYQLIRTIINTRNEVPNKLLDSLNDSPEYEYICSVLAVCPASYCTECIGSILLLKKDLEALNKLNGRSNQEIQLRKLVTNHIYIRENYVNAVAEQKERNALLGINKVLTYSEYLDAIKENKC